jgi:hypothetical protein
MGRGTLSQEIKDLSQRFLRREIDQEELRLYPYLDYCLKNFNRYEQQKLSFEENKIMMQLCMEGHMKVTDKTVEVTKEFFTYLQEVLWLSYIENKLEVK